LFRRLTEWKFSTIKVLGSGCNNCKRLLENTKQAAKNLGLDPDVEYITDMKQVMTYGAMGMPVLVVNEKIASQGKVLKVKEAEKILKKLKGQG
jgi:small redox-active disulfide protein 2